MKEISKEQIIANIEEINKLIDEKLSDPNKSIIKNLFDGEIGEFFFTSPASGKLEYHLACPGGLAQHCLNVYRAFVKLNDAFECNFSDESMFLCSLLHDLGKTCTPDMRAPSYKPQENDWLKQKGVMYETDYSRGYLTNRDRTSFLLQAFGIKVNYEQFQALLLADGFFSEQNSGYNGKYNEKFSIFLHLADFASTMCEKD